MSVEDAKRQAQIPDIVVRFTLTEQDKVRLGEDTETNTRGARHGGQAVPYPDISARAPKPTRSSECSRE